MTVVDPEAIEIINGHTIEISGAAFEVTPETNFMGVPVLTLGVGEDYDYVQWSLSVAQVDELVLVMQKWLDING